MDGCLNAPQSVLFQAPADISDFDPDQQDIPKAVLVCDLHYEKDWNLRRRYVEKCGNVRRDTKPCDGTFACLCKQGDKEFYRVSKTMPVVPRDYTGLNTTLFDTYLLKIDEDGEVEE